MLFSSLIRRDSDGLRCRLGGEEREDLPDELKHLLVSLFTIPSLAGPMLVEVVSHATLDLCIVSNSRVIC